MSNPMPARMPPSKTGDRFGRLLLLGEVPGQTGAPSKRRWNCLCACGSSATPTLKDLRTGHTVSCGCVRREKTVARSATHGLRDHPLYSTWSNLLNRCTNSRGQDYYLYGGRGISVCERWLKPDNFIADMAPTWAEGLSLDRVNNSLGYSPENCRWATLKQQARNKRNNHLLSYRGHNVCLAEAVEIAGLTYSTARYRLSAGWSVQDALESAEFGPPI